AAARDVDVPAVRSERGTIVRPAAASAAAGLRLSRTRAGDLLPRAAVNVILVEIERRIVLVAFVAGDDDELAVSRPLGRHVAQPLRLRELPRPAAVGVDQPKIIGSIAITDEDDAAAIGRVTRRRVERLTARDPRRLAAADRQCVEIAEEVEDDRA